MLSLQIILNEKSLIIKLFSLKIGYKQNQDTEVNWTIFTSKEGKRRLSESEIVLIFRAKHENEVEAQRSEELLIKQKCQSLFTWLCRKYAQGIKILHKTTGGPKVNPNSFGSWINSILATNKWNVYLKKGYE